MSGQHPRGGAPYRHPTHRALWAAAAAIIVLAVGACSYPISGYSWALVYTHQPDQARGQALGLRQRLAHGDSTASSTLAR